MTRFLPRGTKEPEPGALCSHLSSTRALFSPPNPAAEPVITRSVTARESFGTTAPTQTEQGPWARPPRAVTALALLLWGEKHNPTGDRPGSKRCSDSQSTRALGAGVKQSFRVFSLHQLRDPSPRCLLSKKKRSLSTEEWFKPSSEHRSLLPRHPRAAQPRAGTRAGC